MTAVVLPSVRYFTKDSPYHYTEDNKPLQDLASRDDALNTAFQAFTSVNQTVIAAGNWSGLTVKLDLTQDAGKPFTYKARVWAVENQSIAVAQNATYFEAIIMGFSNVNGAVTLSNTVPLTTQVTGTDVLTRTWTASGNSIVLSFSGYTGTSGYVLCKAERFGI